MNRTGGAERVPLIAETENQLNKLLNDFFIGCDLEIEFQTPTLEALEMPSRTKATASKGQLFSLSFDAMPNT
jgi:hypothetical protein